METLVTPETFIHQRGRGRGKLLQSNLSITTSQGTDQKWYLWTGDRYGKVNLIEEFFLSGMS